MKIKTIQYMTVVALVTSMVIGCKKNDFEQSGGTDESVSAQRFTFEAGFDIQTKTVLNEDGSIYWSYHDLIRVAQIDGFGRIAGPGGVFVSDSYVEKECPSASFSGTITDAVDGFTKWTAIYPVTENTKFKNGKGYVTIQSRQTSRTGSFSADNFPAVAVTETSRLKFKNLCGGFQITVSRKGIQKIVLTPNSDTVGFAGTVNVGSESIQSGVPLFDGFNVGYTKENKSSITLTVEGGGEFEPGKAYYATAIPQHVAGGVTIDYYSSDSLCRFISEKDFDIIRSKFGRLDKLDEKVEAQVLSGANSHIVSGARSYSFSAFKGNTTESVGDVKSVKVLWESYGTSTAPQVGDIISSVSYSNGKITCAVTDKEGNAVIAAYDGEDGTGNILWSWHIWCTDEPAEQVYNNGAGTVMDRNLGATSANPGDVGALGLLYQWGRKDPFLGSSSITRAVNAVSTIKWPSPKGASFCISGNNNTLLYSISHPTTYIYDDESYSDDWYCIKVSYRNDTLWKASDKKTIFDPCPRGWRVPDGGGSGLWSKAFGSASSFSPCPLEYGGANFGSSTKMCKSLGSDASIWYPSAGYVYGIGGWLSSTGRQGYYWSCVPDSDNGVLYFYGDGCVYPYGKGKVYPMWGFAKAISRYNCCSVRCVKE